MCNSCSLLLPIGIYVYANEKVADNVALLVVGQLPTVATTPVRILRLTGNSTFVDIYAFSVSVLTLAHCSLSCSLFLYEKIKGSPRAF